MRHALFGAFANLFKPDLGSRGADGISFVRLKIELLSGLTVALALVPELSLIHISEPTRPY